MWWRLDRYSRRRKRVEFEAVHGSHGRRRPRGGSVSIARDWEELKRGRETSDTRPSPLCALEYRYRVRRRRVSLLQGFSCRGTQLEGVWSAIPEGVDILLTHMPPFNRLDLAFDRGTHAKVDPCPVCGETHRRCGRTEYSGIPLVVAILRRSSRAEITTWHALFRGTPESKAFVFLGVKKQQVLLRCFVYGPRLDLKPAAVGFRVFFTPPSNR